MAYQKFNTKLLLSLLPIGLLSAGAQAGSAVINAQKQQTKPQFSIGFTGSMHFGLRVLDTGLKNVSDWGTTTAFDDSMPQNDASSVIDIGTYGNKPLIIGIQADVNYEKFSAGASV
ncbi:hypothetical protein N9C31_03600 [Gammaproteobacteria bacterium]|nr:hypothetical protein [Gammaproteobacteria bacterium]